MKHLIFISVFFWPVISYSISSATTIEQVGYGVYSACVILSDNRVKCWGGNSYGQLGLEDKNGRGDHTGEMGANLPYVNLGTDESIRSLEVGVSHSCVLFESGRIKCWGDNGTGQLGLGDTNHRGDQIGEMGESLPYVNLGTDEPIRSLKVGGRHTCALFESGRIKCWGDNFGGRLGLGDINPRGDQTREMGANLPYVNLGTDESIRSIEVGVSHSCALFESGRIKCWGGNIRGQLGLGDTNHRGDQIGEMGANLPYVNLGTSEPIRSIGTGNNHSCALFESGRVKCWGNNVDGQLGLGDKNHRGDQRGEMGSRLPYVDLGTNEPIQSLRIGGFHSCAIFESGRAKCWGYNFNGQLGLGDINHRGDQSGEMGENLPFIGENFLPVKELAVNNRSTCALLIDWSLRCWGGNSSGQLGLGDTVPRSLAGDLANLEPVRVQ